MNKPSNGVTRRLFVRNGLAAAASVFFCNVGAVSRALAFADAGKLNLAELKGKIKGQVVVPGEPDFDKYAFGELWNKLVPKRHPAVIVHVAEEKDVEEAVKFAKANKLKVVVRGGGHNWCAPSLRNSGMMIDLTELNQVISIDPVARKAVVQPIISNRDAQKALNAQNVAFPSGHCPPVKLSGYLLGGGMSWNQGVWGPGVGSVEAIELVTADGERITASKDQNTDYFWAARGAGCGFFGVALRYHLKLYPLPQYITASSYTYSMDDMETVATWLHKTAKKIPSKVELSIWMVTAPPELQEKAKSHHGKVCQVTASTFADTEEEAKEATKLLDECPVIDKCWAKSQNDHVDFQKLFDFSGSLWQPGRRNHVEAMFSNSDVVDIFKATREHFEACPSPETILMYAVFTGPNVPAPLIEDAAFSMSARLYGGPWTMWTDPKDDAVNYEWHKKLLTLLRPFTAGHYISESDTVAYPHHIQESFIPKNYAKIEQLRKKYDPHGVFFNYTEGLS